MQEKIQPYGRFLSMLWLLCWMPLFALAQSRTVTGKVTDENGGNLPGVNVLVKGTTNGTTTNADGQFSLTVPSGDATLVFSFIGFLTAEKPVGNQSVLGVTLAPDVKALSEVVVIGYGTQERRNVTGAIASVKASDIQSVPSPSTDQLLQGRAAGIQVISNTGAPGGAVTVRIRGATSINASNDPLYVVDGVPIRNESYAGQRGTDGNVVDNFNASTNPLVDINPSDIESIEILKDASATAVYGARAANGVVLITTRRGKAGKPTVTFSSQYGATFAPPKLPLLNGDQNKTYLLERNYNQRGEPGFTQFLPDPLRNPEEEEAYNNNTDWQELVRTNGTLQNYNLGLNGGAENVRYNISVGYYDESGTVIDTRYKRFTSRLNTDYNLSKKLRLGNSVTFTRSHNNRNDEGNAFFTNPLMLSYIKFPFLGLYRQDSLGRDLPVYSPGDFQDRNNPVAVARLMTNDAVNNRLIGNIFGEYDIIPGLTFRTSFGADFTLLKEKRFYPQEGFKQGIRQAQNRNLQDLSWVVDNTLTFNRKFNEIHDLNVLLGSSVQEFTTESIYGQTSRAPTDLDASRDLNSGAVLERATSNTQGYGISSLFARATYVLNDKYSVSGVLKREGSSRFGANNQYAVFPAVSGYWRVSGEEFMAGLGLVSDLKLRGSYGITGNQNGIGNYAARSIFSGGGNYLGNPGVFPRNVASPDLSWESTAQTNVGLDFSILNNRFTLIADYYVKKTRDLLLERNLPGTSGFYTTFQNIGDVENQGIELNLTGDVVRAGDFRWNINYNFSRNRNRITSLPNGEDIIRRFDIFRGIARQGEEIGTWYGHQMLGVYATDEQAYLRQVGTSPEGRPLYELAASAEEAAKDASGNPLVMRNSSANGPAFRGGDVIWADINRDGVISDADLVTIARSQPDFYGGMNNTFSWKGISLDMFLQFAYGHEVINGTRQRLESLTGSDNQLTSTLRRWRKQGDVTDMPRAGDAVENSRQSSRWVEDGSYLRLKTVTLAYVIPKALMNKLKIQNARVYVSGFNLLTFSEYKGLDPEFNTSADPLMLGLDFFNYPQPRKVVVGLNLAF